MRRRLVWSLVSVALLALVAVGLPRPYLVRGAARSEATEHLRREADLIARTLDEDLTAGERIDSAHLERLLDAGQRARLTDRHGRVTLARQERARADDIAVLTPLGGGASLELATGAGVIDRQVRSAVRQLLALALGSLALAVGVALVVARRLAAPFLALAAVSERIGTGEAGIAVPRQYGVAEADLIGAALARSAARVDELLRRERQFTTNVSHQLRTPLTGLRLRLEDMASWPRLDTETRAEVAAMIGQVDRLADTVTALLAFARAETRPVGVSEMGEQLGQAQARWRGRFADQRRGLEVRIDDPARAGIPPALLAQVLDVLLDNALRHGAGQVDVTASVIGTHVRVRVRDEGHALRRVERDIFERGVSEGGSGIGLALARDLLALVDGRLELHATDPTAFDVWVPLSAD